MPAAPDTVDNVLIVTRPAAARDRWVVFADASGVGDALASELRTAGHAVTTVRAGQDYRYRHDDVTLPATDADAYRRLLSDTTANDATRIAGVVHLWSLDAAPDAEASLEQLHAAHAFGCRSVL